MNLLCEKPFKISLIATLFFLTGVLSFASAPLQVRLFGMRNVFVVMTFAQAILTPFLLVTKTLNGAIALYTFLGLTGARQPLSYFYISSLVPITHISFVSLWINGSLPIFAALTSTYFLFYPHWKYLIVAMTILGLALGAVQAYFLVECPILLVIKGDQMGATKSVEVFRKLNTQSTQPLSLYDLTEQVAV